MARSLSKNLKNMYFFIIFQLIYNRTYFLNSFQAAAHDEEKASSDEDDNDDYVDHVQTLKEKGKVVGRASVSAEAFG